jgi:RNA polymerase sigma factor (sigma-70 family)
LRQETVSLDQTQGKENDGATFANKLKDVRPNPENICAKNEMDEALRRALAKLSPKLRDAIQMYLEGTSTRDAAKVLGISTHAVKSRVRRGRSMLNLLLNRSGKAPQAAPIVNATSIEAPAVAEAPALLRIAG